MLVSLLSYFSFFNLMQIICCSRTIAPLFSIQHCLAIPLNFFWRSLPSNEDITRLSKLTAICIRAWNKNQNSQVSVLSSFRCRCCFCCCSAIGQKLSKQTVENKKQNTDTSTSHFDYFSIENTNKEKKSECQIEVSVFYL